MSSRLDVELRAAFETASASVQPAPGLAANVRRATRARRRRQLIRVAASAVVLIVAAGAYVTSGRHNGPAAAHPVGPRVLVRVSFPVSQTAISGRYLYLASNQSSQVAAYDRATGKLVRLITVPGIPDWLAVGPGGLVWVGAIDNGGGQPGAVLLLSPDLTERSTDLSLDGGPVVPTSRQTALAPTQYGLLEVRMSMPGVRGRVSQRRVAGTGLGPSMNTAPGAWAGMLDGRVAVQVTDGYGFHSHLVIAGDPGRTFGGATTYRAGAVASTGRELWVEMFAVKDSYAAPWGPLVRVDSRLRATTPQFVRESAALAKTEAVWSSGDTIWAATGARGHALVCFASRSQAGPVVTVQATGIIVAVAATATTAYVATVGSLSTVMTTTWGPSVVTSYPVPAACR